MVAQAQFSTSDVLVQPGGQETFVLTLVNLGTHTESFTLVPSGLLAGWTQTDPPTVTLFGGSSEHIRVTLRPPALSSTPAGPAPLTVRVIPQSEPDEVAVAETTVVIGSFDDRRLHLLQPVLRGRRRATYELLVENEGNSQASCRLHLIDTTQRLDGDFNPPAVGVEPGGNSLVQLRLKAVQRHWRRAVRTIPFTIEADQQGFPTASANATFVQTPTLPEGIGRKLLALLLLGAVLAGAWFALVKPAAEDAAREAVETPVSTTLPVVTVPGQTLPPQTTAPPNTAPVVEAEDEGALHNVRLQVNVGAGATLGTEYVVPSGQQFHVTDIVLQNPNGDGGTAVLLKNDQVVAQWDLAETFGNNDQLAFVSALVFEPDSKVTFQVTCAETGLGGECVDAVLLSGRLVDL